jgi:uncharacterized protein (TIGR00251 family)
MSGSCYQKLADHIKLNVRVTPGADRSEPTAIRQGELWFRVAAPPEKGKANRELLRSLAKALGVPRSQVLLRSGHGSRHKVLEIAAAGLTPLRRLLDGLEE